jgi:NAD(P)-dependent dehydrogenase (short-subunit alcohol dehydrogenase family)
LGGVEDDALAHCYAETRGEAPGRGRLARRRILVVGGGQREIAEVDPPVGNGRAVCRLFAREGAAVACADAVAEAAAATVAACREEGGAAHDIVADVSDPIAVESMVAEAREALGGLDGLVLNVGIAGPPGGLAAVTVEDWDRVFAVNVRAHMLTCKAALPRLDDGATVVFVGSISGLRLRPNTGNPAYDASKTALHGLCRHMAQEGLARGIRANVVAPGLMDTALGRQATQMRPDRTAGPLPLGRQGTGWEVAYAALFLTSRESAYVNAQILVVDGGLIDLWWRAG